MRKNFQEKTKHTLFRAIPPRQAAWKKATHMYWQAWQVPWWSPDAMFWHLSKHGMCSDTSSIIKVQECSGVRFGVFLGKRSDICPAMKSVFLFNFGSMFFRTAAKTLDAIHPVKKSRKISTEGQLISASAARCLFFFHSLWISLLPDSFLLWCTLIFSTDSQYIVFIFVAFCHLFCSFCEHRGLKLCCIQGSFCLLFVLVGCCFSVCTHRFCCSCLLSLTLLTSHHKMLLKPVQSRVA